MKNAVFIDDRYVLDAYAPARGSIQPVLKSPRHGAGLFHQSLRSCPAYAGMTSPLMFLTT